MKASTITLAALTGVVSAQAVPPNSPVGGPLSFLSPQCEATLENLALNSSFANCSYIQTLITPILMPNVSIVPYLDTWMSDICYSQPCSNDTLMMAASMVSTGCAADLQNSTYITNSTIMTAFEQYPLIREVLCLKTDTPYTNTSYNATLGNPPIPITPATYNSTDGYFCVTSILTQLSAYFMSNLTVDWIEGVATDSNNTAYNMSQTLAKEINYNILCNDCIFAAVDLVEEQYPSVGNVTLMDLLNFFGMPTNASNLMIPANTTLNEFMDGECSYIPLSVTNNGSLPVNVTEVAYNSTWMYNVSFANATLYNMTVAEMTNMTAMMNTTA